MSHHPLLNLSDGRASPDADAGVVVHVDRIVTVRPLSLESSAIDLVDGQTIEVGRPWEAVLQQIAGHPYWSAPQRVMYVEEPQEPQEPTPNPWGPLILHLVEAATTWLASTPQGAELAQHVEDRMRATLGWVVRVQTPVDVPRATPEDRDAVADGHLSPHGWAPEPPYSPYAGHLDADWIRVDDEWCLEIAPDVAGGRRAVWIAGAAVWVPPEIGADHELVVGEPVRWVEVGPLSWSPRPGDVPYPEDPDTTGEGLG